MNLRGILLTPHKSEDLQFLRVLSLSGELLFAVVLVLVRVCIARKLDQHEGKLHGVCSAAPQHMARCHMALMVRMVTLVTVATQHHKRICWKALMHASLNSYEIQKYK